MSERLIQKVLEHVRKMLGGVPPAHGLEHTLRVYNLAMRIADELEGVDREVLALAALLHDVGRALEPKEGRHHAIISAEIAERLLAELGVPREKIERVKEAILAHSFSLGCEPRTLEAAILSDADKLDAIGAIGIARCFMESGARGRGIEASIEHFREKLLKLKDMMRTEPARRLAEARHRFMEEFLRELELELRGER